ncbi:hypothetical protein QF034_006113 [Streptomyces africanus]|uniref:Uncharacterized protein n=1 Tax=Streptomyces africanus TaxID=231024 RepID=A0ABU0QWV2_9ACTN|nr:hypothetical protein [Streptomyces africanus]
MHGWRRGVQVDPLARHVTARMLATAFLSVQRAAIPEPDQTLEPELDTGPEQVPDQGKAPGIDESEAAGWHPAALTELVDLRTGPPEGPPPTSCRRPSRSTLERPYVLGSRGDIEVLAGAVHEAVRPHGMFAGENQRIRRAEGDHIRQEPPVQLRHVRHAAARERAASWGRRPPTRCARCDRRRCAEPATSGGADPGRESGAGRCAGPRAGRCGTDPCAGEACPGHEVLPDQAMCSGSSTTPWIGPRNSSSDFGRRRRNFSRYSARSSATAPVCSGRCGLGVVGGASGAGAGGGAGF